MSERTTLNTVIAWVLGLGAVLFVLMLGGFASGALSDDPPEVSPYAAGSDDDSDVFDTDAYDPGGPASGDGGDDDGATAGGAAVFAITEVSFDGTAFVRVTNVGGAPGSLAGHFLCNRPTYFALPDVTLAPGESLAVGEVDAPSVDGQTVAASGQIGGISASGGEIGLYDSNSFSSSDSILSYVEWAESGHGRSGTAVAAGIWTDGGFVPSDGVGALVATVDFPTSPADWAPAG